MRWIVISIGLLFSLCWIAFIPNAPVSDQTVYQFLAERLALGKGYTNEMGEATATWAPGYPFYLSFFYCTLGISPATAFFANFLCTVTLVSGVYVLTARLFSNRSAIVAASLASIYPSFIFYNTILATELLFSSLLVWAFTFGWICFEGGFTIHRKQWLWIILSGILFGFAVHVRPQALILPIALLATGFTYRFPVVSCIRRVFFIMAIMILTCVPWGLRNQIELGEFVIVSSNVGANLWIGNHEGASGGYISPNIEVEEYKSMEEVDDVLGQKAKEWIRDNPQKAFSLLFKKLYITFKNESIAVVWNRIGITERFGDHAILYFKLLTNTVYFALLLIFVFSFWQITKKGQLRWQHGFLLSILGLMLVPVLVFHGDDRFHLPMIPFITIFISSYAQMGSAKQVPVS